MVLLLNIAQEHRTFLLPFYSRKGSFRNRKAAPSQSEGRFLLPSSPRPPRPSSTTREPNDRRRPPPRGRKGGRGPCPKRSSELPVHYIQVQVICAAVHHAPAFGSQSRQVAVQNGRTYPAPRRHNYFSEAQKRNSLRTGSNSGFVSPRKAVLWEM